MTDRRGSIDLSLCTSILPVVCSHGRLTITHTTPHLYSAQHQRAVKPCTPAPRLLVPRPLLLPRALVWALVARMTPSATMARWQSGRV